MHTFRTRFKKDIVTEFLPPRRKTKKTKVIILLSGAPTVPEKKELMEFLSAKNFWVFFPRYRGTWESNGSFLQKSPHKDVLDILDGLQKPFTELGSGKKFSLKPDKITLVSSSFGGPASLLASSDPGVHSVFAFSPVIDWTKTGKEESLEFFEKFTNKAFGNGYRGRKSDWGKLAKGTFYNPVAHHNKIAGEKITIVHAQDDYVAPYKNSKKFAGKTNSELVTLPSGGHQGTSLLLKKRFYKLLQKITR